MADRRMAGRRMAEKLGWIVGLVAVLTVPGLQGGLLPAQSKAAASPAAKVVPDESADPAAAVSKAAEVSSARPSPAGRDALRRCRTLRAAALAQRGKARFAALAEAASNYDRVAAGFAAEPAVAGVAAFGAAELWRRHGSPAFAERGYLLAAARLPRRFGARGLVAAGDMQRRLGRSADALATYARAINEAPASSHAQAARLARVRLLRDAGRMDAALRAAQLALECARPGSQEVAACNLLALLQIQRGDLDAAERALDCARDSLEDIDPVDRALLERRRRAVQAMSGWRALQRARDRANGTVGDAVRFDADRRCGTSGGIDPAPEPRPQPQSESRNRPQPRPKPQPQPRPQPQAKTPQGGKANELADGR